eukprot:g6272.t1
MEWLQSVAFGIGQEAKTRTTTTPGGSSSTRHGSPFLQPYQRRQVGATKWDLATVSLPMVPALRYLWYAWWKGPPGHSDSSASKELHSLHLADFMFMPNSDSSLRDNDPATFFADPFKATKATGFILHVLGRFAEEAKIFETDRELLEKALLARPWGRGEEQKTGSQYGAEAKKIKEKLKSRALKRMKMLVVVSEKTDAENLAYLMRQLFDREVFPVYTTILGGNGSGAAEVEQLEITKDNFEQFRRYDAELERAAKLFETRGSDADGDDKDEEPGDGRP